MMARAQAAAAAPRPAVAPAFKAIRDNGGTKGGGGGGGICDNGTCRTRKCRVPKDRYGKGGLRFRKECFVDTKGAAPSNAGAAAPRLIQAEVSIDLEMEDVTTILERAWTDAESAPDAAMVGVPDKPFTSQFMQIQWAKTYRVGAEYVKWSPGKDEDGRITRVANYYLGLSKWVVAAPKAAGANKAAAAVKAEQEKEAALGRVERDERIDERTRG
jgi:hypothetical protein